MLNDSNGDSLEPLHVSTAGEGPTVFLVHGWAHSGEVWQGLVALLSDSYRVVAPDLPGFGQSPALPIEEVSLDRYASLLLREVRKESLSGNVSVVIGDSMGGLLVLRRLSDILALTSRVVLLGVPTEGLPRILRLRLAANLARLGLNSLRRLPKPLAIPLLLPFLRLTIPSAPNLRRTVATEVLKANPCSAAALLREIAIQGEVTFDQQPARHGHRSGRITVMRGDRDVFVSQDCMVRLAARLGGSSITLEGVGHTTAVEMPSAIAKLVRRPAR